MFETVHPLPPARDSLDKYQTVKRQFWSMEKQEHTSRIFLLVKDFFAEKVVGVHAQEKSRI